MEQLFEKLNKHNEAQQQLRKELVEKIHEFLTNRGGTFEFSEDDSFFDDIPVITYDGSGHPESASTICNKVYSVSAKRKGNRVLCGVFNTFSANTELCEDYEASRMTFDDIACIFECIHMRVAREK